MSTYNVANKNTGEVWTADEHNDLKDVVNENDAQAVAAQSTADSALAMVTAVGTVAATATAAAAAAESAANAALASANTAQNQNTAQDTAIAAEVSRATIAEGVLSDADIASGALVGSDLVITLKGGATVSIDATAIIADLRVASGVYNATTQAIDFTLTDSSVISVPVSALLPVTTDATLNGDGATTPLSIALSSDAGQAAILGLDGKLYVAQGKDRVFLDNTALSPATEAEPTVPEVQAYNNGLVTSLTNTVLFYTGTDTSSDPSTYVYHIDAAGVVTEIQSPAPIYSPLATWGKLNSILTDLSRTLGEDSIILIDPLTTGASFITDATNVSTSDRFVTLKVLKDASATTFTHIRFAEGGALKESFAFSQANGDYFAFSIAGFDTVEVLDFRETNTTLAYVLRVPGHTDIDNWRIYPNFGDYDAATGAFTQNVSVTGSLTVLDWEVSDANPLDVNILEITAAFDLATFTGTSRVLTLVNTSAGALTISSVADSLTTTEAIQLPAFTAQTFHLSGDNWWRAA